MDDVLSNFIDDSIPPIIESVIEGQTIHAIDGRLLHAWLRVGRVFPTWMSDRIIHYGFVQNVDYWVYTGSGKNPQGGRPTIEYALSIDMAKELSMVENNEWGRKSRRHYIECERRLLEAAKKGPVETAPNLAAIEAEDRSRQARLLEGLAASGLYTPAMASVFKAEALSVLSGKPMTEYLPAVADGRHKWLSPTALGERVGLSAKMVGTVLKRNNLHGETDEDHAHSQPITNKSPHSAREVTSYLYDPAVVLPHLQAAAEAAKPVKKRAKIKPAITLIS